MIVLDIPKMDYGQIEIYNDYFRNVDKKTIKYTPMECIEYKLSYCAIYNDRELPIMIGSSLDISKENPLNLKGYFIIDGICKSVNNIKIKEKIHFSKDRAYLSDDSIIQIKDMFNMTIKNNKNTLKWNLPLNWSDIIKYSDHKKELENHLKIIDSFNKKAEKPIKNEIDLISLCYMFECWLGLREEPRLYYRLVTPGELIHDIIKEKRSVIKCFRTNTWTVKNIRNVFCVSEDMKHYNKIGDLESIRRITIPSSRSNAPMKERRVEDNDKYKICPIQTSDGSLCGTITYLCKDAKITTKIDTIIVEKADNGLHTFFNNTYLGKVKVKTKESDIYCIDKICYIFGNIGRIIKGNYLCSYTGELLDYKNYNPPIRSMFVCNMIKQAITGDSVYSGDILHNTKSLINGDLGHKLEIAIMPWKKFNIEDAIVISNKVSKLFRSKRTIIHRENDVKILNVYVNINQNITKGDLLYRTYDPMQVKTINFVYAEHDGKVKEIIREEKYLKLILIKERDLEVGDKMSSMHGQKGIVSLIENNMPYYYKNGEKVEIDLIINPHAFPSRMTLGQIKEMGEKEEYVYIEDTKLENKIIVGKCLYLALRHQVDDKVQFRNGGNIDIVTKQPVSGRKRSGGLRFGQMERDILIGLGAWNTIKEIWSIDRSKIKIDSKTGRINWIRYDKEMEIGQYFKICLSYMRSLGRDILIKNDKYSIVEFDNSYLPKTDTMKFGDLDVLDLKIYKGIVMLPLCLRSTYLNKLYVDRKYSEAEKEVTKLLKSKNGAYHTLVEGHRVDRCIRSVIVPDPTLDIDTIKIPFGANIGCEYGLLNRQPSLNVDSIKLVKLKQGSNKTIAINPLLCQSFNADFDGDEMNIYGIRNKESIEEMKILAKVIENKTQDYILDKKDLTANKKGILEMIEKGSKGKMFNFEHMFKEIGKVTINKKEINIKGCYNNSINDEEWYEMCKVARENAASISINTPITGYLENICNEMYL